MPYLKSVPLNVLICIVLRKNNNTRIWDKNWFIWRFLDWNLNKPLSYLKPTFSNFSIDKVSCKKKNFKFRNNNALFWYFWVGIWKYYCRSWNQRARIFGVKMKSLRLTTKNAGSSIYDEGLCQKYRSSHPEVFCKKVFLEIFQNSQENICASLRPTSLLKKRPWDRVFPVVFSCEKHLV